MMRKSRPAVDMDLIHAATIAQDAAMTRDALTRGADPDLIFGSANLGRTLLHKVIELKNPDVLQELLSFGVDINVTDLQDDSPLHQAIRQKSFDLADALIKYKADVNIQGTERLCLPPLHVAILLDMKEVRIDRVIYLLNNKADIHVKNKSGMDAKEYVESFKKYYPERADFIQMIFNRLSAGHINEDDVKRAQILEEIQKYIAGGVKEVETKPVTFKKRPKPPQP